MKKIAVIGAGGHSRVVLSELMFAYGLSNCVVVDIGESVGVKTNFFDCQVLEKNFFSQRNETLLGYDYYLAIGDNKTRKEWWNYLISQGFSVPNLISKKASISNGVEIGFGNLICPGAHVGPYAKLGDNNIINTHAIIEHESTVGSHTHLAPASRVLGRATVGDLCMIGAGATILDRVNLIQGVQIGAGSVVLDDIALPNSVHVGVPSRKII